MKSFDSLLNDIGNWFAKIEFKGWLEAGAVLLGAFIIVKIVNKLLKNKSLPIHQHTMLRRLISFVFLMGALLWSLSALGIDISFLLGAAGVLTVAFGFASQTSASNLISGLFLMFERPFEVGDLLEVQGATGYVLSIDVLSIKLRTFDNRLVRIPNEAMIKSNLINLTHFPIRRVDLKLGVAYKENLERVQQILQDVAANNPLAFDEPKPFFLINKFGSSAVEFQFSVWTTKDNYWELLNMLYIEVKAQFDEQGVEIPFPHFSLYAGSASKPISVEMVDRGSDGSPGR